MRFFRKYQKGEHTKIGPGCHIGKNVELGHWSKIGANVQIADNIKLGSWSHIGDNTIINSDVVFGDWTQIGKNCEIGEGTVFGSHTRVADGTIVPPNLSFDDCDLITPYGMFKNRCSGSVLQERDGQVFVSMAAGEFLFPTAQLKALFTEKSDVVENFMWGDDNFLADYCVSERRDQFIPHEPEETSELSF